MLLAVSALPGPGARGPRHGHAASGYEGLHELQGHGDGLRAHGSDRSAADGIPADEGGQRVDEGPSSPRGACPTPAWRAGGRSAGAGPGKACSVRMIAARRRPQLARDARGLDAGHERARCAPRRSRLNVKTAGRAREAEGHVRRHDRLLRRAAGDPAAVRSPTRMRYDEKTLEAELSVYEMPGGARPVRPRRLRRSCRELRKAADKVLRGGEDRRPSCSAGRGDMGTFGVQGAGSWKKGDPPGVTSLAMEAGALRPHRPLARPQRGRSRSRWT